MTTPTRTFLVPGLLISAVAALLALPGPTYAAPADPLGGAGATTLTRARTTGYTWYDNDPPRSRRIARPQVHHAAGGTGTFEDPITMAVGHAVVGPHRRDVADYPSGTRFYVPHLRRYFVVEDLCGGGRRPQDEPCHDLRTAPRATRTWVDLWVGGAHANRRALQRCAEKITSGDGRALHTIVEHPADDLPVVRGPLFAHGRCTALYSPAVPEATPAATAPTSSTSTPSTSAPSTSVPSLPTSPSTPAPPPTMPSTVTTPPSSAPTTPPTTPPATPGGLAGWDFYVDPRSPAAQQAQAWEQQGRSADAAVMRRLAEQPVATWVTSADGVAQARRTVDAADAAGKAALLVLYDVPDRDCGSYSAGGSADSIAYHETVTSLAAAIGDRRAAVVVEPDAIPQAMTGCLAGTPAEDERYSLLRDAVAALAAQPRTRVYLDAGNARWIADPAALVGPLRAAGIDLADGFSLNVSNFLTTDETTAYGDRLARLLGGKHFVIDTGRNGAGPLASDSSGPAWCNPPGRALGATPTVDTGDPLVDAWLWVKPPGESDGSCRPGEPPAGAWWPDYALMLAVNAGW